MKAITIHQPYASLIAWRFKRYETRHWTTRYRGTIAIHAGKKWTRTMQAYWEDLCDSYPEPKGYKAAELPLGCVVAACRLVNVHRVETVSPGALESVVGNFAPGRYAWEMEVVKLPPEPIPAVGQQGIWEWVHEARR